MKIVFLHIPKTAGQSIHAGLVDAFGSEVVCPARVNEQLQVMSIKEINKYSVFSGHFDWSLLDCLKGNVYVFTVLRDPLERILSFYFYLYAKASKLSFEELSKPENSGMKSIVTLSPDEYFLGGNPSIRRFLDNHYDNFYTYFFAGRRYSSRAELSGLVKRQILNKEKIQILALENLLELNDVFLLNNISEVFSKIKQLSGSSNFLPDNYYVNVNKEVDSNIRLNEIKKMGLSDLGIERINQFCEMDRMLLKKISN